MRIMNCVCLMICASLLFSGCDKATKATKTSKPHNAKVTVTPPLVMKGGSVSPVAGSTTGGSSYRKAYETLFNTASNFVWKAAATAPAIRAVEMSYATGLTNANTFTLSYVRNGISRELLTVSGTMHTLTWYVPGEFYAMEGDVWTWSNTAAGSAVLTVYADYQY